MKFTSLVFLLLITQIGMAQTPSKVGKWETINAKNETLARHECSFVNVGDQFYLMGGRGIKPVAIYDLKTNSWTDGKEPPIEIHHFQVVAYQGIIYMFSAMTGKFPYETPLKNILIYNPKTNEWSEGEAIPEGRQRGSAGVVLQGDKAYIVSGIVDGHNSKHVPWMDVYDFKIKKWTILADAPRARDHFHAVLKDGKIYAAGGRNSSFSTKQTFDLTIPEVDVYDIKTNQWSTLPKESNLPVLRAGASVVVLGNDLIVIGGESMQQKEAHNDVDAYNFGIKTWRKLDNLNTGRHGTQAIIYKNTIYIAAGCGSRGGKPELSSIEMFKFD